MSYKLTPGAIQGIIGGETIDKPILQMLSSKKIPSAASADRYRLLLSDGQVSYSSVMLATQLNSMMESGELENMSVIKVDKFLCNTIQNDKKVVILLDISVIARGTEVGQKIGNPQSYRAAEAAPAATSTSAPSIVASKPSVSAPPVNRPSLSNGAINNNKPADQTLTPGGGGRVNAIASLTPYQNRWKIRARVSHKSAVRTWSNSRGDGKLFSITLLDESGEIRATGFNDAVDKWHDFIEVNKVYYISKAYLKTANKQYTSVQNNYEMTFNSDTTVELCSEEGDLPTLSFDFKKLKDLNEVEPNSIIDVIGVVTTVGDVTTIVGRQSNKEFSKREIQIADQSGMSVRLTLWGAEAENFEGPNKPVIAVKGAKVSDWGGRTLSLLSSSQMIVTPDIREAHFLRGWYDRDGCTMDFSTFQGDGGGGAGLPANWKTFGQVKAENLGSTKPDYFAAKGTVIFIRKENCMYMACPTEGCNKKMVDQANGQYRCEKCNQEFPNFKWRLILSANVADYSDNQWITCFQESAESMLGITADELGTLKESNEAGFDQVFQEANFKSYNFRLRAKVETYNDESRLKTVCMNANAIDWREYGQRLLTEINSAAESA